ncbi:23S rRNA (guanine(745)-N(1))-methyltransferase [Roseimaritima multifibrata]|uniref:23S rRNA (Guanine(745)-N(1))-methyltransferase n=1 Tax=Roseimaritima multifibrata TaxID=1930274 RepID=A0A517MG48_9BACT|nr:methyltransferase domain-containing protein [Roseimaritima multifibrata]QDS93737.1 23S rRNA (guanine(745)-N(1))-methyltransferase [Roseimaritima multifibrata]
MFQLRCTVRDCCQILEPRENSLFCSNGHHFDQAKGGYWNLLQPQDRRSRNPGDVEEAVLARHRWLERGHAQGLIDTLQPWVADSRGTATGSDCRTLDLGCGEGSFASALFPDDIDSYCGIDLSKKAIKLASRSTPAATWVLANADRILPAPDRSVQRVVSLFGRRPISEIKRVMAPAGYALIALPGEEDLIELRQRVQKAGHRRSRWELVVEEMAAAELDCVDRKNWTQTIELDPPAIQDALAMTYRAVRHSQQSQLDTLTAMNVTFAADLMLFRHRS